MRVYLAGPWVDRHQMPALASKLEAAGHTITERWWDFEEDEKHRVGVDEDPYLEDRAVADFVGVMHADAVVVLNTAKSEGKAVEQGVAFAHFKPVIVIGKKTNIFHYLPNVQTVDTVEIAIERLE